MCAYPFERIPAVGEGVDPDDLRTSLRESVFTPDNQTFTIPVGASIDTLYDTKIFGRIKLPTGEFHYGVGATGAKWILTPLIYWGFNLTPSPRSGGVWFPFKTWVVSRGADWTAANYTELFSDYAAYNASNPVRRYWVYQTIPTWLNILDDPLDVIFYAYVFGNPLPALPYTVTMADICLVYIDHPP